MKKNTYFLFLIFLSAIIFLNGCAGIIPPPPQPKIIPSNFIITPENAAAGSEIIVKVTYQVLYAPPEGIAVNEKSVLLYKEEELTTLDNTSITRENGSHEIKYSFNVPAKAAKGQYEIKQTISAPQAGSFANIKSFNVK